VDLTDTESLVTVISIVAMVVGLVGIVVPVLPGLVLCWAGVLVWALFGGAGWSRWVVLAVATGIAIGGTVVKYLLPGRNLKRAGVPNRSLFVGGVLGLVGFFVVPVVGLPLGFVVGILLAELIRLTDFKLAWKGTLAALKAVGISMIIEICAGLSIAAIWVVGLFLA